MVRVLVPGTGTTVTAAGTSLHLFPPQIEDISKIINKNHLLVHRFNVQLSTR